MMILQSFRRAPSRDILRAVLSAAILACCLGAPNITAIAQADAQSATGQATHEMSDFETPAFAEAMAVEKAKRAALKDIVVLVEHYAKDNHLKLTREEVEAVAGGSVRVELLEKRRTLVGDQLHIAVKVKVVLQHDKMKALAGGAKDSAFLKEYKKLQEEYAALDREVDSLRASSKQEDATSVARSLAQERSREHGSALEGIQKREGALYERLITGSKLHAEAERQLAEQRRRPHKQSDATAMVFEEILRRGHEITIGEPEVKARLQEKGQADLYFPVSIKGNEAVQATIKEVLASVGGELRNATYRKFTQRLQNLWFVLELSLGDGSSQVCYVPVHIDKFRPDGEFVTMEEGQSKYKLRISVPLASVRDIKSVRGRFMESMPGSACGLSRIS